jgi:hypothetical protein
MLDSVFNELRLLASNLSEHVKSGQSRALQIRPVAGPGQVGGFLS